MKHLPIQIILLAFWSLSTSAQSGWTICKTPGLQSRVDDIYMVDGKVGYAACGDGKIIKTTDGGLNWANIQETKNLYCRSVEFFDTLRGFAGGFPTNGNQTNILRKTTDGGKTWTDLSPIIHPKALAGICGLAIADANTVYGCGNWFQDSAYLVKSINGGNSWTFIDMANDASSLIDLHFTSKDTGFAVGRGPLPKKEAVILYTTNGGIHWDVVFKDTIYNETVWKIQHLSNQHYFAAIENAPNAKARILNSVDGGKTWQTNLISDSSHRIQGVGFLNLKTGWAGGDLFHSFETQDGGKSWAKVSICPALNRFFKVSDTVLFVSGTEIWKYNSLTTGIAKANLEPEVYANMRCYPIPTQKELNIEVNLIHATRLVLTLIDEYGKEIKTIENNDKPVGKLIYQLDTSTINAGVYYLALKTHTDYQTFKVLLNH
jgi:photosystem II stability/assembly factor-like uncharacterized protein